MRFIPLKDENLEASGHRTPPLQITLSLQCLEVVEGCPGIDIEVLADLPYRRGITFLFNKSSDKIEDLFLSGRQFHLSSLNPKHEIRNSKQAQIFKTQIS